MSPDQRTVRVAPPAVPSAWRAWWFLVRLSFLRQARAHLMVWVALGLLALTLFIVGLSTRMGLYNRAFDRWPEERGRPLLAYLSDLDQATALAFQPPAATVRDMVVGAYRVGVSPAWRLGKKLLGVYLPYRFRAGRPFNAGAPWRAMDVGLKAMSTLLARR